MKQKERSRSPIRWVRWGAQEMRMMEARLVMQFLPDWDLSAVDEMEKDLKRLRIRRGMVAQKQPKGAKA